MITIGRNIQYLIFGILLVLAAVVLPFLVPRAALPEGSSFSGIKDRSVLLFSGNVYDFEKQQQILELFYKQGVSSGVTLVNTPVHIFDYYTDTAAIPYGELSGRLDPLDSRLDDFIRKLPALFKGRVGESEGFVIYFPSSVKAVQIRNILKDSPYLEGSDFVIPGAVGNDRKYYYIAAAVLVLIWFAPMFLGFKKFSGIKKHFFRLIFFPLWAVGLFLSGFTLLPGIGVLMSLFLVTSSGDLRFFTGKIWSGESQYKLIDWVKIVSPLILALTAQSLFIPGLQALAGILIIYLSFCSLSRGLAFVFQWKKRRMEHRPFIFTSLQFAPNHRKRDFFPVIHHGAVFLTLLVLLVLPFFPESRVEGAGALPLPVSPETPTENLADLLNKKIEHSIPAWKDYVAHRIYQESYLYGNDYDNPSLTLFESRYSMSSDNPDVMVRRPVAVKEFTDDWYRSIISASRGERIEGILFNGGTNGFAVGEWRENSHLEISQKISYSAAVFALILVLFLLLTLPAGDNGVISSFILLIRRKNQSHEWVEDF